VVSPSFSSPAAVPTAAAAGIATGHDLDVLKDLQGYHCNFFFF
jgi:hypothetical protein